MEIILDDTCSFLPLIKRFERAEYEQPANIGALRVPLPGADVIDEPDWRAKYCLTTVSEPELTRREGSIVLAKVGVVARQATACAPTPGAKPIRGGAAGNSLYHEKASICTMCRL